MLRWQILGESAILTSHINIWLGECQNAFPAAPTRTLSICSHCRILMEWVAVSESVSQSVSLSVSQSAWLPWLACRILSTVRCGFCHSSCLLQGCRILSRCSRAVCSCGMQLPSSKYKKLPAWNNNAPCGPSKTLLPSTSSCTTPPPLPDNFWVMKLALAKTERLRDQGEIYAQVVFCKSYGLIITTWQCLQWIFSCCLAALCWRLSILTCERFS